MPDGTTYVMTQNGFTSESKDKKIKKEFIDQKSREDLVTTIDKETMKKMKPDNTTLSSELQTWLDGAATNANDNINDNNDNSSSTNQQ